MGIYTTNVLYAENEKKEIVWKIEVDHLYTSKNMLFNLKKKDFESFYDVLTDSLTFYYEVSGFFTYDGPLSSVDYNKKYSLEVSKFLEYKELVVELYDIFTNFATYDYTDINKHCSEIFKLYDVNSDLLFKDLRKYYDNCIDFNVLGADLNIAKNELLKIDDNISLYKRDNIDNEINALYIKKLKMYITSLEHFGAKIANYQQIFGFRNSEFD